MFLQVSVCPQGGSAPGGPGLGGCLVQDVSGLGGGVPAPRGVCLGRCLVGGAGIPACTEADLPPQERWLLLRMVRILLEYILANSKLSRIKYCHTKAMIDLNLC